jgi:hypothetical protein
MVNLGSVEALDALRRFRRDGGPSRIEKSRQIEHRQFRFIEAEI